MSDEIARRLLGAAPVGEQGSYAGSAVHREVARAHLAAHLAREDWAKYLERFGLGVPRVYPINRSRYWTVHRIAWLGRRRNRRRRRAGQ